MWGHYSVKDLVSLYKNNGDMVALRYLGMAIAPNLVATVNDAQLVTIMEQLTL